MINIICSKTWCINNGQSSSFHKCYIDNVTIKDNECNMYECQRMALVRMNELDDNEPYGGCRFCLNGKCKHKR